MNKKIALFILFGVFFIFRLLLVPLAHHGDLNNNISWGNEAADQGLVNFYERENWPFSAPNQPPLYIILFSVTSYLYKLISSVSWNLNSSFSFFPSGFIWFWQRWGMDYLVKLPSIISDILIAWVVYKFFERKNKINLGFKIALLWLVNPIIWYNSAVWGQTDAIVNLFGLASIYFLLNKNMVKAFLLFTLSILFKGSLLAFAPLIVAVSLFQKHKLVTWVKAAGVCVFAVVIISIWFHPQIDFPVWLVRLYTLKFFPGEIGFLTANAFNFWWLVDSGKTQDAKIFFGLTARLWGIIILCLSELMLILSLQKKVSDKKVLISFVIVALVTFLFMTRIHERYLYPLFPYLTLLTGVSFIWLIALTIFSIINLVNVYNLFWVPPIPVLEKALSEGGLANILAIINIVAFLLVVFLVVFKSKLFESKDSI